MSQWGLWLIAILAPIMGVALWIGVTTVIGAMSGWFRLMQRFPNQPDSARLSLSWQSGAMGIGVNYNNVLRLATCDTGLRVGVPRLFGIYARDFLVPWRDIRVKRYKSFFVDFVELTFGDPAVGRLVVRAATADRLRESIPKLWPEKPGT